MAGEIMQEGIRIRIYIYIYIVNNFLRQEGSETDKK